MAGVGIGHAITPAHRVVFQRTHRRDRFADALEVAAALTYVDLAELAGITQYALNSSATFRAFLAVLQAYRIAAGAVTPPYAVSAAGVALKATWIATRTALHILYSRWHA